MIKDKHKVVQRGQKAHLSGLLFVCLLFRPKPVFSADEYHVNELSSRSQNRGFSTLYGSKTIFKGKKSQYVMVLSVHLP